MGQNRTIPTIAISLAFALGVLMATSPSHAEYRVFRLAITDATTGASRTVISNLDDLQYPGYHPLKKTETIAIEATWMCWERSEDFKPYCPNPNEQSGTP